MEKTNILQFVFEEVGGRGEGVVPDVMTDM